MGGAESRHMLLESYRGRWGGGGAEGRGGGRYLLATDNNQSKY